MCVNFLNIQLHSKAPYSTWKFHYEPLNSIVALCLVLDVNDLEQLKLTVQPENATGQLAQKLFQHTSNRVHRIVFHVHETAALQKMDQLFDGVLVAGRAENVFAQRCFLVYFEYEHQQRARYAVLAHFVQRDAKLYFLQTVWIWWTVRRMAARCDDAAESGGASVHPFGPGAHGVALVVYIVYSYICDGMYGAC